jgi:hypothetical protein
MMTDFLVCLIEQAAHRTPDPSRKSFVQYAQHPVPKSRFQFGFTISRTWTSTTSYTIHDVAVARVCFTSIYVQDSTPGTIFIGGVETVFD